MTVLIRTSPKRRVLLYSTCAVPSGLREKPRYKVSKMIKRIQLIAFERTQGSPIESGTLLSVTFNNDGACVLFACGGSRTTGFLQEYASATNRTRNSGAIAGRTRVTAWPNSFRSFARSRRTPMSAASRWLGISSAAWKRDVGGFPADGRGFATGKFNDFYGIWVQHPTEAEFNTFAHLLGKGGVYFDIGANMGLTTVIAARAGEPSHIVAFEPTHKFAAVWHKNVQKNGVRNASLFQCAVGEAPGTLEFIVNPMRRCTIG